MSPPDLVFVNCTYDTFTPANSGAIGTWVWELCRLAERDALRPLVITRSSPHPQYERSGTIFIDYPRLPKGRLLRKAVSIQQRIAGWAHPRHGSYCELVATAIRVAGAQHVPLILSNDVELAVYLRDRFPRAFILHHAQNNNTSPSRYRRRFARSASVATACSDFTARWNEQYFGMPCGSIRTIFNGADSRRFRPLHDAQADRPIINYVGKTDPIKGPDVLLRAALKLSESTERFSIQIVGRKHYDRDEPDPYQDELRRMARELEARGVPVTFTGWINRAGLPEVLGRAHIHVVPSRWDEPCALTLFEGMSSGMAVIGSRTGGTPEVIGDSGFLFARDDTNELAAILKRLVLEPSLREEWGRRARARAVEFGWDRVWREVRALLPLAPAGQSGSAAVVPMDESCLL